MNLNNWYKSDVIDKNTAEQLLTMFTNMIDNLGRTFSYVPFVNGRYLSAVQMRGYYEYSEDKSVGSFEVTHKGRILVSAKEFIESNLMPSKNARIDWNGQRLSIINFAYVSQDSTEVVVDKLENAFLIVFNVVSDTVNKALSPVG